jgi:hypothetical protein
MKTSQSILYREIIAVCPEIRTEHIKTESGHNLQILNVVTVGTALKVTTGL